MIIFKPRIIRKEKDAVMTMLVNEMVQLTVSERSEVLSQVGAVIHARGWQTEERLEPSNEL